MALPEKPKVKPSIAPTPSFLDRMFSSFGYDTAPPPLPRMDTNLPDLRAGVTQVRDPGLDVDESNTYLGGGYRDPRWKEWGNRIAQQDNPRPWDINLPDENLGKVMGSFTLQGKPVNQIGGSWSDPRWQEHFARRRMQQENDQRLKQQKQRMFDSVTLNPTKRTQ